MQSTMNINVGFNETMMRIFLAIMWISVGVLGCTNIEGNKSTYVINQDAPDISEKDVINAAKEYLDERNVSYVDTRINAEWHADAWWVVFSSQVPKPGGDFVVLVSHQGRAIEIIPGE